MGHREIIVHHTYRQMRVLLSFVALIFNFADSALSEMFQRSHAILLKRWRRRSWRWRGGDGDEVELRGKGESLKVKSFLRWYCRVKMRDFFQIPQKFLMLRRCCPQGSRSDTGLISSVLLGRIPPEIRSGLGCPENPRSLGPMLDRTVDSRRREVVDRRSTKRLS